MVHLGIEERYLEVVEGAESEGLVQTTERYLGSKQRHSSLEIFCFSNSLTGV